ncbi:MAG: dihydroorotase [Candidatus Micrarchaeota archaeon]
MFIRSKRVFIDGKLKPACLSVHTGRFGGVHSYTYMNEEALDAEDWIILPGAIDVHVHMREPEYPRKEDFTSGSQAAVAGGVTSFLDMPCYRSPCTSTVGALTAKERLASTKSICDFGFHFGATNDNADLIKRFQPNSLKAFLAETDSPLTLALSGFERHFGAFDKLKPILCHCEDQDIIDENKKKFKEHEKIRSTKAALSGVKKINKLARKFKRRVHFCHLTTSAEVKACKVGNSKIRLPVKDATSVQLHTCEVSPHHLFLSTADLPKLRQYGISNPPLRTKAEVAKLWKALSHVDCIASDHAPHLSSEKERGAPGFPGVQTMVPLLLSKVFERKFSLKKAVQLFSSGPAECFTIQRKGKIASGYDADFMVVDPQQSWKINSQELFSKAGWSPYEGLTLKGKILGTFVRGEQVHWDNEILVRPGYGERIQCAKKIGSERLVLRKHSKER